MDKKDTLHYLKIVEIGKSKDLPQLVITELENRDLIELIYIDDKPAFSGNHILSDEGLKLLQNSR